MEYRRCENSGLKPSGFSLGLWHNFGYNSHFENSKNLIKAAFDMGIANFDLANNFGVPTESAKECFGRISKLNFKHQRPDPDTPLEETMAALR